MRLHKADTEKSPDALAYRMVPAKVASLITSAISQGKFMKIKSLGRTGIEVSQICLGTMTWGTQNTLEEASAQMDYAVENGVNFFDTAEMYPVTPIGPETYGRTEEFIGEWLSARKKRDDIVLASKVAGPGRPWVRDGSPLTPEGIRTALDDSLKRLKTDYIDLYQVHWSNRNHFHFRNSWTYSPYGDSPPLILMR